jgi:type II secretory pathway component PulF
MLFTPGHFSCRADFYHQLAQLTGAGLTIFNALQHLQRNPPAASFRAPIRQALLDIESGLTVSESFARHRDWMPQFDLALLHAGERSGRLEATFRMLAEFYTERAAMARRILGSLAYPALLLHAAIFILPFPELFLSGNVVAYVLKTVGVLVPIYALVLLAVFLSQGRHGESWRSILEGITGWIPLVGVGRRQMALARLAAALEALINAGETIVEAWPLAAAGSGSPALRREVHSWKGALAAGQTPAELLSDSSRFPETFCNLYSSGEISGTLDETLRRLHRYYRDEGTNHLRMAARIGPGIVYALVVLYIAWKVISFWTGYFQQINNVMNG